MGGCVDLLYPRVNFSEWLACNHIHSPVLHDALITSVTSLLARVADATTTIRDRSNTDDSHCYSYCPSIHCSVIPESHQAIPFGCQKSWPLPLGDRSHCPGELKECFDFAHTPWFLCTYCNAPVAPVRGPVPEVSGLGSPFAGWESFFQI